PPAMRRSPTVRGALLGLCLVLAWPLSAFPVTKSEVEAACQDSKEAYAAFLEAQDRFAQAAVAYEEAVNDVARVEHQQAHIADTSEGRKAAHQKEIGRASCRERG